MKSISEWASGFSANDRPWLLLGKGPSFAHFEPRMAGEFHVMGLNHVSSQVGVTLAHFIDMDAFLACVPDVLSTARWVVIPWHPHADFAPSAKTLGDYVREVPELGTLERESRLLTYNLSTAEGLEPLRGAPRIEAEFFSAEAGLNVLASVGARRVRSLGVDGGTRYSAQFDDIASKTRLANGHKTFDLQFRGIARTIRRTGIDYSPFHVDSPVRVFVGADSTQELPLRVLEFSIRKFASASVEFRRIVPNDGGTQSHTAFSFAPFEIPKLCGRSGRAIYFDAAMQVFADLLELWETPFDGASVLRPEPHMREGRVRPDVLLLDCAKLEWDADALVDAFDDAQSSSESLVSHYDFPRVSEQERCAGLPSVWNPLERYVPGETRLVQYTDMSAQPWITGKNRRNQVWLNDLRAALEEGCISDTLLFDQIDRGYVSPGLPRCLGIDAPSRFLEQERTWKPPYLRAAGRGPAGHDVEGPAPGNAAAGRTIWDRVMSHLRSGTSC